MRIDPRELLMEYRKAAAALAAAEAAAANGREDPPDYDEWVARWHGPVDRAIGRLRAAVLLLHGLDPHEAEFDRPVAVAVGGTLLVATDRREDPEMRGLVVVAADDVVGLG